MIRFSIHLPARLILSVKLTKKRKGLDDIPLLPPMGRVMRAKKGSKISRLFRLIFENSKIKKIIGTNLTFLAIATSVIPSHTTQLSGESEINFITSPILLNTQSGIHFPVEEVRLTQGYYIYHRGIDLDGKTGDTIRPIMDGIVKKVEYSRFGYGKSVIVSHGSGIESLYAHLSKIEVAEGQIVTKDTKIGEMGATGRAFGDHLHLEIYENGKEVNPLTFLK